LLLVCANTWAMGRCSAWCGTPSRINCWHGECGCRVQIQGFGTVSCCGKLLAWHGNTPWPTGAVAMQGCLHGGTPVYLMWCCVCSASN
jgi:hypothetical protein